MLETVALIGVPSDIGNGVAPGARKAPAALRRRMTRLSPRIRDAGDVVVPVGSGMEMLRFGIRMAVTEARARGERPLVLGGDHSITMPAVEASAAEQELAILWLDAHTDLDELTAARVLNHKNVLRHILGLPSVTHIVHVGHRGYTVDDELSAFADRLVGVTAGAFRAHGNEAVIESLPARTPVYISVDIDVLDPAVAPATATPVPGGLRLTELLGLLDEVGAHRKVAGADLVEVNPALDREGRTVRAAVETLGALARCLSADSPTRLIAR